MDSFPYLLALFLITIFAFWLWSARSWAKAEKALDKDDSQQEKARMAAERSPTGELISDFVAERDGTAK